MYGQSQAIASNLAQMSTLKVPVISIVTGEGSSGGALGIAVANRVYMLENAIYSVLSPEGFASILWHDSEKRDEAAEVMKLTAKDLLEFGVIDGIISERGCGLSVVEGEEISNSYSRLYSRVDKQITAALKELEGFSADEIAAERFGKFRNIDERFLEKESRARMGNI